MDHASLHWVHSEIEDSLSHARWQLESFAEDGANSDAMRECVASLHDVRGVLEMLEVYGVSLLTEEMETLALALADKRIPRWREAAEILMRAIVQLPEYLEYVRAGRRDNPFILLPLLNDLRAVRGKPLLSENVLFNPNLAANITGLSGKPVPSDARIRSLARQLRPFYLKGLVGWFKGAKKDQGLGLLRAVFAHLEDLSGERPLAPLWWIGYGVVEALENESLETSVSVKLLLGRIDSYIKALIDHGGTALGARPAAKLHKNLLYYLAIPDSQGERVSAVRAAYALEGLVPGRDELASAERTMAGPNLDALRTVADALKEDLAKVKDTLDTFVRNEQAIVADLAGLPPILRHVADTLGLLSLGVPRKVVLEQGAAIERAIETGDPPDDEAFMAIAGALLSVDGALDALAAEGVDRPPAPTGEDAMADPGETQLSGVEFLQLVTTVIGEAKADLAVVKDAISSYIAEPDSRQRLLGIPSRIKQVEGGLRMLSLPRAADLLARWGILVAGRLSADRPIPDAAFLDDLADAIVTLEYYLEAVAEARPDNEHILDAAEQRIARLDEQDVDAADGAASEQAVDAARPGSDSAADPELLAESETSEFTLDPRLAGTTSAVGDDAPPLPENIAQTLRDAQDRLQRMDEEAIPAEDRLPPDAVPSVSADAEPADSSGDAADPEILEIFLEEAHEVHATLGQVIPSWLREPEDREMLATIRRCFHTLKGSGRMAGAQTIGEFAWRIENVLNRVIERVTAATPEVTDLVHSAYKALPELLEQVGVDPANGAVDIAALARRAEALSSPEPADQSVAPTSLEQAQPEADNSQPPPEPATDSKKKTDGALSTDHGAAGATILDFPAQGPSSDGDEESHDPLIAIFREEALHRVEALKQDITDDNRGYAASGLARAFHGLSGSASTAGVAPIARLCGAAGEWLQSVLDPDQTVTLTPSASTGRDLVKATVTALQEAVVELSPSGEIEPGRFADLFHRLHDARQPPAEQTLDTTERDELREIFLEEGQEILQSIDAALQRLRLDPKQPEALTSLRRDLHTLKGGARMAQMDVIGHLSHALESLLANWTDQVPRHASALLDLTERGYDGLGEMLLAAQNGRQPAAADGVEQAIDAWLRERGTIDTPDPVDAVAPPLPDTADIEHDTLLDVFLAEADEILLRADADLSTLTHDPDNRAALENLRREMHTLKGGARMAGLEATGELGHCAESLLELACGGHLKATSELLDLQQAVQQRLRAMLAAHAQGETPEEAGDLIARMDAQVSPELAGAEAQDEGRHTTDAAALINFERRPFAERIQVDAQLLDNLVNNAGEISIAQARIRQHGGTVARNLEEMDQTISRLKSQLRRLEIEAESQILSRTDGHLDALKEADFDPLEFDRYTRVQQLSRSLLETVNDLTSIRDLLGDLHRESDALLIQQARVNTDLQDGLMRTRMQPFARHVSRFRRLVRRTASDLGKQVRLVVNGGDINIDRAVMNRILGPLDHMLRNAVDHGIESPALRQQANKPETGVVTLNVARDGADVTIEVSDDGHGMDIEAIRAQAIDRALMKQDADLTDEELVQFVLEANFTTADELTEISGRGVGMDVVNTEIKQLGGMLSIESNSGHGTLLTIRLPMTLTINQALMVAIGEDSFAVPLASVEGVVRLNRRQLDALLDADTPVFRHLGLKYQFAYLGTLLDIGDPHYADRDDRFPLVLVRAGEHRMAFSVDRLGARQEVVVKSVGPQLSSIRWITGATIQGDGRVVLVLDIPALVRMGVALHGVVRLKSDQPTGDEAGERMPTVLVVDDSITVRKVTERFLVRHGFKVQTAKDGVEALALLQEHPPDIMLLDIEMPRMDGFELATTVRNDQRLKTLPIIMITSRTGHKHADRAVQIGVDRYLGKPYHESELLANINALIGAA